MREENRRALLLNSTINGVSAGVFYRVLCTVQLTGRYWQTIYLPLFLFVSRFRIDASFISGTSPESYLVSFPFGSCILVLPYLKLQGYMGHRLPKPWLCTCPIFCFQSQTLLFLFRCILFLTSGCLRF